MIEYSMWFKRTKGSIYGVLTLQKSVGGITQKIFEKITAASGQVGYTNGGAQDWVVGKSPTPIGEYWLSTKSELLQMSPVNTRAYCMSTRKGERTLEKNGKTRTNCLLHLDNLFPGSVGCIAVPDYRLGNRVFDFLDELYLLGVPFIKIHVFW